MSDPARPSRPIGPSQRSALSTPQGLPVTRWRALLQKVAHLFLLAPLVFAALSSSVQATQTKTLLSAGQNLLTGYPAGVRALESGVLLEGPAFILSADLPALPLCAAGNGAVTWVGTAPAGDLLRVEGSQVSVAHHFDEPLVTALAVLPGGALLVGTSTPAKVYRFDPGQGNAALLGDLKADYVWALRPDEGSFLAATGMPGKLLRVFEGGKTEVVLEPGAAHVRCLAGSGTLLWAGTSGPGSIYRSEGGRVFLAASLKQEEVVALVPSSRGLWVSVNEKSDPSAPSKGGKPAGASALLYLQEGLVPQEVRSFPSPALCAAPDGEACLVGLADGRLFSVTGTEVSLLAHWEEAPVSALLTAPATSALTAGPNALYKAGMAGSRSFTSPVANFSAPARVGRCTVQGRGATLFIRVGNSPKPGAFWSAWVPAEKAPELAPSQYAQWKADLAPGGEVRGVSLPYRAENRPPVFRSAEVRAPGEVSVRMPSQLGDHLVREVHEKEMAFPGLAQSAAADAPPQTYYLQGFRMVSWKTEDPDGDEVRVTAQFRPAGSEVWFTLAERVADPYYVFDARSLADGVYALRLTADDDSSNPEGEARRSLLELPDFTVDNTPPRLTLSAAGAGKLSVSAQDNTAIQAVRYSLDGKRWQALSPPEWTPGSSTLSGEVPLPSGGPHWITVEAVDLYRNRSSEAWLQEK